MYKKEPRKRMCRLIQIAAGLAHKKGIIHYRYLISVLSTKKLPNKKH